METTIEKLAAAEQRVPLDDDEQSFGEWLPKRLSLYQSLEQQVQARISQTVQFANDFARQMDDEAERLLARHRQARLEQQQARDGLLKEQSELRAALAELRRHHEVEIAQARRQAEVEIAQARRQAETEIAQQQARASAERERVLREAYAERERILTDSRKLASRLAGLQRSLSDMLQPGPASGPAEASLPFIDPDLLLEAAPQRGVASPELHAPLYAVEEGAQLLDALEAVGSMPQEPSPDVDVQSCTAVPVSGAASAPALEYEVQISGVVSFITASDLIDDMCKLPDVTGVRLLEYEQRSLRVLVIYAGLLPLAALLQDHISVAASSDEGHDGCIRLVYQIEK